MTKEQRKAAKALLAAEINKEQDATTENQIDQP
jgi:hypothetical protein